MGTILSNTYFNGSRPYEVPELNVEPSFEPEYGFEVPRKPRGIFDESKLTLQEMKALKIPKNRRDYCAHLYRDYKLCERYYTPVLGMCKPEMHAYEHCQMEDYILRMKEYERERRLRMRKMRKQES